MVTLVLLITLSTIAVWNLTKSWAILGSYWISMIILLAVCGFINYLLVAPVR